mgnify:FL=1
MCLLCGLYASPLKEQHIIEKTLLREEDGKGLTWRKFLLLLLLLQMNSVWKDAEGRALETMF